MEVLKGLDVVLLYRVLNKAATEAAWKMAFQTEHSNSMTRDANSTATKDGNVQTLNPVEYDMSATSMVAIGDPHVDEMKHALLNGEIVEIWEINKVEKGTGENKDKYKATYYQGYVSEFAPTAGTEDSVELSLSFAINGVGQEGYATLTNDQAEVVQYAFADTTKQAPTVPPTPTVGGITGNSKDGYIITGNTNPGNTIIVKTSQGKIVGTIATDDKGNYAVTILAGKVNPEDVLQIVGKDIAGNESLAANIKTPADPKAPIQ